MPGSGLAGNEHTAHVDGEDPVEVGQVELGHGCHRQDACVVDQDVEPTECLDRRLHGLLHSAGIGTVGAQGQGFAASVVDFCCQGLSGVRRADIGKGHLRPFLGQTAHDRRTDAARTALDQGYLGVESK
ncbi:hypothetical protein D3C80_1742010 [compost metagenome]